MDLTPHLDQIIVMFFVFFASITVLNLLVFKPTLKILQERDHHLVGLEKKAHNLESQYTEKFAAYTRLMDEAKVKARQARDAILKTAETEQKQVLAAARTESESLIVSAKHDLSLQTQEARLKLRAYSQDLAKNMVASVLKRKAA